MSAEDSNKEPNEVFKEYALECAERLRAHSPDVLAMDASESLAFGIFFGIKDALKIAYREEGEEE